MRCMWTSMLPGRLTAAVGGLLTAVCCMTAASVALCEDEETPTIQTADEASVPVAAPPAAASRNGLRVRIKLDVSGELLAPTGNDSPPVREPVEMSARFDFAETPPGKSAAKPDPAVGVCRAYRDATASMRVGDATTTATLAADARRILVARQGMMPMPYLADGFLSGEESDLLETPFDALLLDELLPKQPVSIGQAWAIAPDATAGLLAIDTVESGALEARLQEVSDGRAKVVFAGIIDGAADGVPTHVTVEGSFAVTATGAPATGSDTSTDTGVDTSTDTSTDTDPAAGSPPSPYELQGSVSQLSAVIRERRQASHVAPGFEVEARLSVACSPLDAAADTTDSEVTGPDATESPSSRRRGAGMPGRVWYRESQGRFDLVHDTRWRRVEDGANGLVMRLLDRGALVGQCSITSLPQAGAASLPTGQAVQRDIERSLSGQVVRSDAVEESDRADGLRVVRVASSGTAGRLPFRWIHYVLAAPDGSRVSVTFMYEDSMAQRFGDVDRLLVEGLRLPATGPQSDQSGHPDSTAAVPGEGRLQTR